MAQPVPNLPFEKDVKKPHQQNDTSDSEKQNLNFKKLSIAEKQPKHNVKTAQPQNVDEGTRSEQPAVLKPKKIRNRTPKNPTAGGESVISATANEPKETKHGDANPPVNSVRQKEHSKKYEKNIKKLQIYINSAQKSPNKDLQSSSNKDSSRETPRKTVAAAARPTKPKNAPPSREESPENPEINTENNSTVKQNSTESVIANPTHPSIVTHSETEDTVRLVVMPAGCSSTDGAEGKNGNEGGPRPVTLVLPRKELAWFKQQNILPLKHINPRFCRAMFHCRLCSFHISSIPEVYRHIKDDRHVNLQHIESIKRTASLMPDPTPDMVDVVGKLVENVYQCSCLLQKDLDDRAAALNSFRKLIESNLPGLGIQTYGSYVTGLGVQNSNVNTSLVKTGPMEASSGLIIISVLNLLRSRPTNWGHVEEDFNCRVPIIHFDDVQYSVRFTVVVDNDLACRTSLLLRQYQLLEPRYAVLTVAFRIWAATCQLDQPELGTLPTHAFSLLVLYFMQQSGLLPVLHRSIKGNDEQPEDRDEDHDDDEEDQEQYEDEDDKDVPVLDTSPTPNVGDTYLSN